MYMIAGEVMPEGLSKIQQVQWNRENKAKLAGGA
jgi:hypothetical protein